MTSKFDEKSDRADGKLSEIADDSMDDDASVDIDITDNSSEISVKSSARVETPKVNEKLPENSPIKATAKVIENCDKKLVSDKALVATSGIIERTASPLPLIKKLNRDGTKHVTKNWLISDCPKRKPDGKIPEPSSKPFTPIENQENSAINLIRVEDLVNKKHSTVRPKPVNELLKQIREINNQSPFRNTNENFKVELEDERMKPGANICIVMTCY